MENVKIQLSLGEGENLELQLGTITEEGSMKEIFKQINHDEEGKGEKDRDVK